MGAVVDEDTGQEPSCIFCDSKDDCPHLVAVIDRTFAECTGGALYEAIDNLREILSDKILATLSAAKDFDSGTVDDDIAAIAQQARDNHDSEYPDDIYIDEHRFLAWLTEALINAGAEEPSGHIVEEGGPGLSSALTLLYASDPRLMIETVEKTLRSAAGGL